MKNSLTPSKNKQNNFVDIAFYADFGATYGKGYEISNIAYECKRLGILGSVFIRTKGDNKTLRNKQKTAFPFGAFFFKILTFIEKKLFKNFKSRYWQEVFFDFLISRKLRCGKNKLFYGVPRMHHSFVRAKQLGYVTVLHAAEQNAYKNLEILTKVYPDTKFPTIWSKNNDAPFNSEIKIYKDKFFVIDLSNTLRCFSLKDGSELWNIKTENSLIRSQKKLSMVIVDNVILFNNFSIFSK